MAINKKLIHFKKKADFDTQLSAGNILDTSIVFIKDAKQIFTHGQLYPCPFTEDEIRNLLSTKADLSKLNNYLTKADASATYQPKGNYITSIPTANGTTAGIVKQGGDVTISNGVITVNDDSHNHIISNVDGLQSALDAKQDIISDLSIIRSGASKGATALQSVPVATASANGLMAAADKSLSNFLQSYGTATTLASLDVSKSVIYATLSAATSISLSAALAVGRSITVICNPTASFTQPIPTSGSYISMDGDSLTVDSGKIFEINILCYASGKYSISCKTAK